MDENPSPGSSRNVAMRRHRNRQAVEDDDGVDKITCTGKSCQSCTAGVIADCVAVCCCPCAVVNLLALAFIKVPWMVGRKWFGMGKKNRQLKEKRRKCERSYSDCCGDTFGISGKGRVNGGTVLEIVSPEEELPDNFSAGFEDEEIFHLGFGRVSFTGIPCETKGN
ncbi:uncharacterized protein LOC111392332 [Olea europaea var. sylvestris]|uniref:uncharacterized protein LOC111392332 n=1 Tax=Olea europaea var. sylvestris TaxID=158386 RepID=UPI000C1D35CB|nr:uncharacterized protein LOC111392332 [Olea europaea var. sylvestris]XP_022873425.1 uncharacterized protein LOC111392332 [Olea europaea var. sylvestris]